MTTTVLTSHATSGNGFNRGRKKSYLFSHNIYEVEVNGEAGEFRKYEIMADTAAAATATAEQLAYDDMVNISFITVMVMG